MKITKDIQELIRKVKYRKQDYINEIFNIKKNYDFSSSIFYNRPIPDACFNQLKYYQGKFDQIDDTLHLINQ